MESFPQCAIQMLREFRAVLRISPIPITQMRLLQLVALNMFAIESTQLKGEWSVGWFDVGEIDGWRGGWFYSSDLLIVIFGGSCPPLDIITVNRILEGAKQRDCLMIQISNGSRNSKRQNKRLRSEGLFMDIYIARSVEEETKWLDMDRLNKALDNIQFVSSLRIRLELF